MSLWGPFSFNHYTESRGNHLTHITKQSHWVKKAQIPSSQTGQHVSHQKELQQLSRRQNWHRPWTHYCSHSQSKNLSESSVHTACIGAYVSPESTGSVVSGCYFELSPCCSRASCPSLDCGFELGASWFTESHSHWLYLGLLRLFGPTSFLFQPGRCSKPADTCASEAGHHSPLPETSPLSWRLRLRALRTGQ